MNKIKEGFLFVVTKKGSFLPLPPNHSDYSKIGAIAWRIGRKLGKIYSRFF